MEQLSRSLGNARATLMLRKIVRFGTVAALVLSAFGATSVFAGAPKIDVSPSTIVCSTVVGTASIKPALSITGTATTVELVLKGTVDGCQVISGNSAKIVSGSSFSGKLVGAGGNNCTALLSVSLSGQPVTSGLAGNVVFKWKTDPSTPLLQTTSTVAVNSLTASFFLAGHADPNFHGLYPSFAIGVIGVGGAFEGTDVGATSTIFAGTGQDSFAILNGCGSVKGVKRINLSLGTIILQ